MLGQRFKDCREEEVRDDDINWRECVIRTSRMFKKIHNFLEEYRWKIMSVKFGSCCNSCKENYPWRSEHAHNLCYFFNVLSNEQKERPIGDETEMVEGHQNCLTLLTAQTFRFGNFVCSTSWRRALHSVVWRYWEHEGLCDKSSGHIYFRWLPGDLQELAGVLQDVKWSD